MVTTVISGLVALFDGKRRVRPDDGGWGETSPGDGAAARWGGKVAPSDFEVVSGVDDGGRRSQGGASFEPETLRNYSRACEGFVS